MFSPVFHTSQNNAMLGHMRALIKSVSGSVYLHVLGFSVLLMIDLSHAMTNCAIAHRSDSAISCCPHLTMV